MEKPEKKVVNFHIYSDGTRDVYFTDEWYPKDKLGWTFKEDKKMEIPEGQVMEISIIGKMNGEVKKYTPETFPKDASGFEWMETRSKKLPIPNYKPVAAETKSILNKPGVDVSINVLDPASGDIIGSYKPSKKGTYVIILNPGNYKLEVEADGYDKISEDLNIYDKSSYLPTILKDITLIQKGLVQTTPTKP